MNIHYLQLFGEDGAANTTPATAAETPETGAEIAPDTQPWQESQTEPAQQDPQQLDRALRYQAARNAAIQRQYAIWGQQAQAMKEEYPDFDMNQEVQNLQFRRYLHAGLDVKSAYVLVNHQKLLERNAQEVEKRIAQRMSVAATRPSENGGAAQASAVGPMGVAGMSRKERDAIRKNVARGARVTF